MRVLFVCTANICRSAYAEVMARHLLGDETSVEVGSAGTHGYLDHPLDPPMAEQLRRRGVDPNGFRSRRLTPALLGEADLVLTAQTAHRERILEERPERFRRVLTLGQLARTLEEAGVGDDHPVRGAALLEELRAVFVPAEARDDVVDPYRRGEEAAARAAEHLDALLRRVRPVLA